MKPLYYIYPEVLPSNHARTTTVVKSVAQLQHYFDLTLVVDSQTADIAAIEAAYGVELNKVRLVRLSKSFLGLRSNVFFNRALLKLLPQDGEILLYLRHIKTADAVLAKRASTWRIIFEAHELFYKTSGKDQRAMAKLFKRENYIYNHCDGIVSIAQTLRDDINATFSPNARSIYLPTGTDVPAVMPAKDFSRIDVIHYIGGLMPWKGVDTLIEAYAMAHDSLPPLEIIGGANPKRIRELTNRIEKMGLAKKVRLRSHLPHAEVVDLIHSQTKLCVFPNSPSSYERYTMPLKLFEYMAGNNIVVYSRIPSLAEVEAQGTIGVGFAPGNSDELAAVLRRICNDAQAYAPMAKAAFELVGQFSWEARAKRFAEFARGL